MHFYEALLQKNAGSALCHVCVYRLHAQVLPATALVAWSTMHAGYGNVYSYRCPTVGDLDRCQENPSQVRK